MQNTFLKKEKQPRLSLPESHCSTLTALRFLLPGTRLGEWPLCDLPGPGEQTERSLRHGPKAFLCSVPVIAAKTVNIPSGRTQPRRRNTTSPFSTPRPQPRVPACGCLPVCAPGRVCSAGVHCSAARPQPPGAPPTRPPESRVPGNKWRALAGRRDSKGRSPVWGSCWKVGRKRGRGRDFQQQRGPLRPICKMDTPLSAVSAFRPLPWPAVESVDCLLPG